MPGRITYKEGGGWDLLRQHVLPRESQHRRTHSNIASYNLPTRRSSEHERGFFDESKNLGWTFSHPRGGFANVVQAAQAAQKAHKRNASSASNTSPASKSSKRSKWSITANKPLKRSPRSSERVSIPSKKACSIKSCKSKTPPSSCKKSCKSRAQIIVPATKYPKPKRSSKRSPQKLPKTKTPTPKKSLDLSSLTWEFSEPVK